jgi:thymidine phosphorylase
MRAEDQDQQKKIHAALNRAVEALESAMKDQEDAAVRIAGLAERIVERTKDAPTQLQAEAIMESCTFQDIAAQKIQKVVRLLKYLRDSDVAKPAEVPLGDAKRGLSQDEVSRLLSGGKPLVGR